MALTRREQAFQAFALTHWVEHKRNTLELHGPGGRVGIIGLDDSRSEMAQHGELLGWGFKNRRLLAS